MIRLLTCTMLISLLISCNENSTGINEPTNKLPIGTYLLDYQINYGSSGEQSGCTDYKYDVKGQKIEEIHYDADSSIWSHYQYEYNSRGLLSKDIDINHPDPSPLRPEDTIATRFSTVYSYDNQNRMISKHYYEEDGKLTAFSLYKFNSRGLKQKYTVYERDSTPTYWCTWEYYKNDSIYKTTQFNEDSTLDEYAIYEYNKWGVNIYTLYNYDSSIQCYAEMGYDSLGRNVTEMVSVGNLTRNYRFDYDTNNNLSTRSFCYYPDSCRIEKEEFYVKYLGKALGKRLGSIAETGLSNPVPKTPKWKEILESEKYQGKAPGLRRR